MYFIFDFSYMYINNIINEYIMYNQYNIIDIKTKKPKINL